MIHCFSNRNLQGSRHLRLIPFVAIAFGTLSVASCVSYRPQPLDLAATQQSFSIRALSDSQLQALLSAQVSARDASDASNGMWSQNSLLIAALRFNPAVVEARAKLAEALSGVRTAKALPDVKLGLAGEYDLSQVAESPWLWSITTEFLLDALLRQRLRTAIAESSVRGARLDYAETVWSVRRDLRGALLATVIAEQRVTLLENAERDRSQLVQMLERRMASGEAAMPEILQSQLELTRARSALIVARRDRVDTNVRVANIVGVPLSALDTIHFRWDELDSPTVQETAKLQSLRQLALLSRADLERAVVDYDTRELELKQAIRAQYPQFSLGPGFTWDHGIRKATFAMSIGLPLSGNRGPIAAANARREIAGAHLLSVQSQVMNEIDGAQLAFAAASESVQLIKQQYAQAQALADKTEHAMQLGEADKPTVLAARLIAYAEQLLLLDAADRMQQSLGAWEDALRTPLTRDEIALPRLER